MGLIVQTKERKPVCKMYKGLYTFSGVVSLQGKIKHNIHSDKYFKLNNVNNCYDKSHKYLIYE
jgi:hypothetical protein